ncbi:MAG: sulfatase family protein [Verrucomicrobiales bacterium]
MATPIVLAHLLVFVVSAVALTLAASASDSKFVGVALKDHRSFLVWTNLDLLRGYALVAFAYTLLAYPAVRLWLRNRVLPKPWAIIWRTLVVSWVFFAFSWLRLIQSRPYFLTVEDYDHWYFRLLTGLPETIQHRVFFLLFDFLPAVVWLGAAVFYGTRLLLRWLPGWPLARAARVALAVCLLPVAGWFAAPLFRGEQKMQRRTTGAPNILVLASDSLRADRLSCNGYSRPTSPNIDRLAARSVNCTRMLTPIASTLESVTTIMTGQYPHTHGLQHMYPSKLLLSRVLRNSPALPEILGRHNYKTVALGDWCAGIFHIVPLGFQQIQASAFDDFKLYMAQAAYIPHFIVPLYFDNDFGYWMFPQIQSFANYVTPEVVTERLVERLDVETESDRPFFITAFYSCTHIPYYCPPPYHQRYARPDYNGRNKFKMDFNVQSFVRGTGIDEEFKSWPPHEIEQVRDLYDGCVNFFDDQVGRVLDHLERTGLSENTIVIVTSDHGDDLFDPNTTFSHGLSFNGGDQTNHMPFIVHVPSGKFPSGKVERITRAVDIAPTLLDLAGLPPEPSFEGTSLLPYLSKHDSDLSLPFFGETSYPFFKSSVPDADPRNFVPLEEAAQIDPDFNYHFVLKEKYESDLLRSKQRCLRTEKWKLVFTPGVHRDFWHLFYLPTDPHCQNPVQLQHPQVWHAMEEKLKLWVDGRKECRISDIFPDGEPGAILPGS